MIEIEFSVLVKECLNQRIPTKKQLEGEILTVVKERNDKQIKIDWQFSLKKARAKLNCHYKSLNEHNQKFIET